MVCCTSSTALAVVQHSLCSVLTIHCTGGEGEGVGRRGEGGGGGGAAGIVITVWSVECAREGAAEVLQV
jgi:hypothetical protein